MSKPAHIPLSRDPYRFTCPRGHHALRSLATSADYVCESCRANGDQHHYTPDRLIDKKAVARADDGEWCGP